MTPEIEEQQPDVRDYCYASNGHSPGGVCFHRIYSGSSRQCWEPEQRSLDHCNIPAGERLVGVRVFSGEPVQEMVVLSRHTGCAIASQLLMETEPMVVAFGCR